MTTKQRMSILLDRWPSACRAQRWNPQDRALRLQVISHAVNRRITTMNDLDNGPDIDAVYAHLGMLADNLALTKETLPAEPVTVSAGRRTITKPATAGERRRILWLIRQHAAPLGGEPYIHSIVADNPHIVSGWTSLDDLTTQQLHQLMTTLAARHSAKRRSAKNASLTSEGSFPDQVAFQPDPEFVAGPF